MIGGSFIGIRRSTTQLSHDAQGVFLDLNGMDQFSGFNFKLLMQAFHHDFAARKGEGRS